MSGVRLLIGTKKGAFILTADGKREKWDIQGPEFGGMPFFHLKGSPVDPNRLYASQTSDWFGQVMQRSDDGGKTWATVGNKFEYEGAAGTLFYLWPGSTLFEKKPKWIVAGEAIETSQRYLRTILRQAMESAGFSVYEGEKSRHKGMLYSVYVDPTARGTGLAAGLVEAVLDHARGRVEQVDLHVNGNNQTARRLYQRFGFQAYGTEPRSLKVDGQYHDEVLMVLRLD